MEREESTEMLTASVDDNAKIVDNVCQSRKGMEAQPGQRYVKKYGKEYRPQYKGRRPQLNLTQKNGPRYPTEKIIPLTHPQEK